MSCLSLRSVFSVIIVLCVGLVMALTLTVTLITGLDALRSLGQRQTRDLAANAVKRVGGLFAVPEAASEGLRTTMLAPQLSDQWPSNSRKTLTSWIDTAHLLFRQCNPGTTVGATKAMTFLFADNSNVIVAYAPDPTVVADDESFDTGVGTYIVTIVRSPSPIGSADPTTNTTALQLQTQTISTALQFVKNNSAVRMTPTLQSIFTVPLNTKIRDPQGIWQTINQLSRSKPFTAGVATLGLSAKVAVGVISLVVPLIRRRPTVPSEVFGYFSAQVEIGSLSANLAATVASYAPSSFIAAVASNGYLVATSLENTIPSTRIIPNSNYSYAAANESCQAPAIQNNGLGTAFFMSLCRLALAAYPFEPLRAAGTDWVLSATTTGQFKSYVVNDDIYYAYAMLVPMLYPGLTISVLVVTPEKQVIGDVVASQNLSIGIAVAVMVATCCAAFVVTTLLLGPLRHLATRMSKAARFADDADADELSYMCEVRELQEAYYDLNGELLRIRSFVPQSVLARYQAAAAATTRSAELEAQSNRSSRRIPTSRPSPIAPATPTAEAMTDRDDDSEASLYQDASSLQPDTASDRSKQKARRNARQQRVLRLAVKRQLVTVVYARLRGLHRHAQAVPCGSEVIFVIAELAEAASRSVTAYGGIVALYSGDSVMATFNAVKKCEGHATRGSIAACRLVKAVEAAREDSSSSAPSWAIRAGVSTGMCMVGNVGSETAKNHSTMGSAVSEASALETLSWRYGAGCRVLGTRRLVNEADTNVMHVYVDIVKGSASREGPRAIAVAALYDRDAEGEIECTLRDQLPRITSQPTIGDAASGAAMPSWLYGSNSAGGKDSDSGRGADGAASRFTLRNEVVEALATGQCTRAMRLLADGISSSWNRQQQLQHPQLHSSTHAGTSSGAPSPLLSPTESTVGLHYHAPPATAALVVTGPRHLDLPLNANYHNHNHHLHQPLAPLPHSAGASMIDFLIE